VRNPARSWLRDSQLCGGGAERAVLTHQKNCEEVQSKVIAQDDAVAFAQLQLGMKPVRNFPRLLP
jgi:hypothetical protein